VSYLELNFIFLATAVIPAIIVLRGREWFTVAKVLGPMLLLTAIFDNLIIATGIVAYEPQNISGIMIGVAPIEDFAYTIAAVLLITTIWHWFGRGKK
jgi:lycopene cyclase domain-containing protein